MLRRIIDRTFLRVLPVIQTAEPEKSEWNKLEFPVLYLHNLHGNFLQVCRINILGTDGRLFGHERIAGISMA